MSRRLQPGDASSHRCGRAGPGRQPPPGRCRCRERCGVGKQIDEAQHSRGGDLGEPQEVGQARLRLPTQPPTHNIAASPHLGGDGGGGGGALKPTHQPGDRLDLPWLLGGCPGNPLLQHIIHRTAGAMGQPGERRRGGPSSAAFPQIDDVGGVLEATGERPLAPIKSGLSLMEPHWSQESRQ